MLEFSPQMKYFNVEWEPPIKAYLEIEDMTEHQKHIYMALQDKNHYLASETLAYSHYKKRQQEKKQRVPKAGNLVLIKNYTVNRQRGRKLQNK